MPSHFYPTNSTIKQGLPPLISLTHYYLIYHEDLEHAAVVAAPNGAVKLARPPQFRQPIGREREQRDLALLPQEVGVVGAEAVEFRESVGQ